MIPALEASKVFQTTIDWIPIRIKTETEVKASTRVRGEARAISGTQRRRKAAL
jgi:hypothetical protein